MPAATCSGVSFSSGPITSTSAIAIAVLCWCGHRYLSE